MVLSLRYEAAVLYERVTADVGVVEVRFVGYFARRRWGRKHHDGHHRRRVRAHERWQGDCQVDGRDDARRRRVDRMRRDSIEDP